jgi:hypothetical protein
MAEAIYVTCALTSVACALMLWRGYRANRTPLLFWSSLCFAGLALNNVLLFVDKVVVPSVDLTLWRSGSALLALVLLLFGLVWESK